MTTGRRLHYDYADYLRSLEVSPLKLEYCEGVIYAMAGGTRAHAELSAAVIGILHRLLPKGCRPATSEEVTSKSTEDYDRGDKLSHYKQLPSLQVVLYVSHRTRKITVVERTAAGWDERELRGGEQVSLASPSISFAVDAVYEGITLDPA